MRGQTFLEFYRGDEGRRLLARQAALLVVAALVLLTLFEVGDLDRTVTRRFFDAARGTFPLVDAWWLKTVLHDAARTTSAVAALVLLALTVAAWLAPGTKRAHAHRHALAFAAVGVLAAAAVVGLLKHWSSHACPWDIEEFGGTVPYRHLLTAHGPLPPLAGCFPAAHPLVGYAWFSVGLALRPSAPRAGTISTLVALVLGTALGFVQVLRGAHFVSHVLWSAWMAWTVHLTLLVLCRWWGACRTAATAGVGATP